MMAKVDILNGFVSKVMSDCIDISVKSIKNADENRKSYSQNIQTRIYQLIIDALNEFTYNKYSGQGKLYEAAESILKGLKTNEKEVVKSGLSIFISQVTDDICVDFLGTLRREICKDENRDLKDEIIIIRQKQMIEDIQEGFRNNNQNHEKIDNKLDDAIKGINYIKEAMNNPKGHTVEHDEIPVENRAEEYARKWDKNVFLNDFNEMDETKGKNIRLKDIYLKEHLPHFIWRKNRKTHIDLRTLLSKYVISTDEKKMLLILGQAGIGKSTLITWIMANLVKRKECILVYQFASDLKNVDWQGDVLKEILKSLHLRHNELEDKVLILDGFDEIYANDDREKILNKLKQELNDMGSLKKFSLIITCRENYIYKLQNIECDYITLQPWDERQIKSFCQIYEKESENKNSGTRINKIIENKEVFGIPLILYMTLALGITIEENGSIVDVYDQIFSLEKGGIYDRCIKDSRYGAEHRINTAKWQIHQLSQKIAFWMFENNAEKAFISQEEYEKICTDVTNQSLQREADIKRDLLIGNYFRLVKHCEGVGTEELQFVHRSIYEYFVAVYFFESVRKLSSKGKVAGKLGELLKDGQLSKQMLEFIKYKFDNIKGHNLPDTVKNIFQIMLRDGMLYYTEERYKNSIEREMNVFFNMLKVIHLWNSELGELDNRIVLYLKYNEQNSLSLSGIKLKRVELEEVNLMGANLGGADLEGADLEKANLKRANLRGANLRGANLRRANLSDADLGRADLEGVDLEEADLSGTDLKEANLKRANLAGANLSKGFLEKADLSGVSLKGADLKKANLSGANLKGADLREADLMLAYLSGVELEKADLKGVDLRNLDLKGLDLKKADLSGADLSGANLSEVNLMEANLEEANLIGANLKDTNLSKAYLARTNLEIASLLKLYLERLHLIKD